eukprot:2889034-Rhodomonas_salina.2
MLLRAGYAMSSTDVGYPPTCLLCDVRYAVRACYAMSGTDIGYAATRPLPPRPTRNATVDDRAQVSAYACAVLGSRLLLRNVRYWDSECCSMPTRLLCDVRQGAAHYSNAVVPSAVLASRVVVHIHLRARYAMSGTELACGAMRCPLGEAGATELATALYAPLSSYARAMPCPVLVGVGYYLSTHVLCHVRYWYSVSAYARAMRCPVLMQRMVLPGGGLQP